MVLRRIVDASGINAVAGRLFRYGHIADGCMELLVRAHSLITHHTRHTCPRPLAPCPGSESSQTRPASALTGLFASLVPEACITPLRSHYGRPGVYDAKSTAVVLEREDDEDCGSAFGVDGVPCVPRHRTAHACQARWCMSASAPSLCAYTQTCSGSSASHQC